MIDWLFDRSWVDPILVLLALLTALATFAHFFHRRGR